MSETIQATNPVFVPGTMKYVEAVVAKGTTAPANGTVLKAGYPVAAKGDGTYQILTGAALATALKGSTSALPVALGILAETVTVAATMTAKVLVATAGDFLVGGLRDASGITATDLPDYVLIEAHGHLNAVVADNEQIYDL